MRLRLLVGFVSAMLIVNIAAGAFVFWRVQSALDHRLNEDLRTQTSDLRQAALRLPPAEALASLRGEAREAQLLRADGSPLASGPAIPPGRALLTAAETQQASTAALHTSRGYLFSKRGKHARILAIPIGSGGHAAVAVTAVLLDQRDEALRELLAQLAVASLVALAVASLVGYRFAHVALDPVERYRSQAERITHGDKGVRLDVPPGPSDEITRLGTTLNTMLDALDRSARQQQQFIDDASHELRTPLSTLSAEIDIAQRKPRTIAEHEATLQRLATDTNNLIELAETLLTLGAVGSAQLDLQNIPASELIEAAARRARSQNNVELQRDVTTHAQKDISVRGDHVLLSLALGNLVDNAIRHGVGAITLTAEQRSNATILTVSDEGTIDPQFLSAAAERFRRDAHPARAPEQDSDSR